MNSYNTFELGAIGVVEVSFYTSAVLILDEMLKASEVQLVSCEKKLGGRLVSIIVAGDTSSVEAAVERAVELGKLVGEKTIKVAVTISNPHPEIIKLLNLVKKSSCLNNLAGRVLQSESTEIKNDEVKKRQTQRTAKEK